MDNESLSEGETKDTNSDKNSRPSSDVVVLLDLKKCNEPDTMSARFLPSLISTLEKELVSQKITKNRYSLIVFGGQTPYDSPRVRTVNGQEFVAAKETANLFENLPYGIKNFDILLKVGSCFIVSRQWSSWNYGCAGTGLSTQLQTRSVKNLYSTALF